ncbi:hypothetical protein GCK72_023303 [Caenorhabditis remanei]|uniref:DUF38 domain-containing protein n=1 Tax=Caenorhabditis remanei TaxID=31234 RepID=A0A6A5FWI0_CAERE|nr:hypothetical protein GCK72_023303 [Caenorhabditis remanei]KAF1746845.1 hypothetical protein GCK72_023303 [Caenorhabditis remanei]
MPSLNMLPVVLKRKITDQVNIEDQDALVRVNKGFRTYLRADRRVFNLVRICLDENEAVLCKVYKDTKEEKIIITTRDGGCIVDKNGETTTYENSMIDQVLIEFRETIKKRGTKIADVTVKFNSEMQGGDKMFFKGVCDVFSELKEPLHVEKLDLRTIETNKMNSILRNIKIGALNSLTYEAIDVHTIDMRDLNNLDDHVPFLRTLAILSLSFKNVPLSNFAHISCIYLKAVISQQELSDYKNKLINSSIGPYHTLETTLTTEEIKEAFRPYETISPGINQFEGSFRHSLLDKKINFTTTDGLVLLRFF